MYVLKVVIAELIQGAMTEKEIAVIEYFVNAFLVIDQTADILINLRGDIRLDPKSEQFKRRYRKRRTSHRMASGMWPAGPKDNISLSGNIMYI